MSVSCWINMWRITFLVLFIATSEAIGQSNLDNPVAYNDYIVQEQRATVQKNLEYITFSIHSDDYHLIEEKRKDVVQQIRQSIKKINKMPPFKGDSRLKNDALDVLKEYQNAFEINFKEVANLQKERQTSFEAMELYFEGQNEAEKRVNRATIRFNKAQEAFVKRNNLTFGDGVEENELTRRMETVTALNQYARGIFLEYFKVSKAFAEMLDVLNDKKAGPLDKRRKDVIEMANAAIPKLKAIGDFNGDQDYLDQTISLTDYYRQLAENEFRVMVDIFRHNPKITHEHAKYINQVLRDYQANAEVLVYNLHLANNTLMQNNISPNQ